MARYSAGVKTGAGSTTLPLISLYASASVTPKIREIGVFNTTGTALDIKLVRLTTTGTQGAGLTEECHDDEEATAASTGFTTHTVAPTLGNDLGYRATLAAQAGAVVIWTFGDTGIRVPKGTGNGLGVIIENGTGQACQAYIVWDE